MIVVFIIRCVMYRVFNNNVCSSLMNKFYKCENIHSKCTRGLYKNFFVPYSKTTSRHNFLAVHRVILWNNLPLVIRDLLFLSRFKIELKSYRLRNT